MSKGDEGKTDKAIAQKMPRLGYSNDEIRLLRIWGPGIPFEETERRISYLELVALFYGLDTKADDWISDLMFRLAQEHPQISKKKRANGRPKSLQKFGNDRSFLKFAFKLRGALSRAHGRQVSYRKVANYMAALDLMRQKEVDYEEAKRSSELEDRATYLAKRIATLRKAHPDIEADSRKPTQLSGTDNRESA